MGGCLQVPKRVARLERVIFHAGNAVIRKLGKSYTTPPLEVESVTNAISAAAKLVADPPFATSCM